MTLQQIRYIIAIAKCGSIRKASEELHVAQSHLSTTLKTLENELGITIFLRTSKGVTLTHEGDEFLNYAKPLLIQEDNILQLYSQSVTKPIFRFTLSTQRYPFIIKAFFTFFENYDPSEYEVHLREASMYKVINDVFNKKSDLGIIFISNITERFIKRYLATKELEFNIIKEITPCVFFRKTHPLAKNDFITLEEMDCYPYASFESETSLSPDFSEEVLPYSLSTKKKNFYVTDRGTMINVLTHTDAFSIGTGILSEGFAGSDLISKPISGYNNQIHLGWIKRVSTKTNNIINEFIEEITTLI